MRVFRDRLGRGSPPARAETNRLRRPWADPSGGSLPEGPPKHADFHELGGNKNFFAQMQNR